MTDHDLLHQYTHDHSESAFAELVRRHIDWVYSACRRQLRDPSLAEDVTQAVFITLARKAATLSPAVSLSGWLFTTARYASASAKKIEARRRKHERQAATMTTESATPDDNWNHIEPLLDEALARLSAADREAVILRYFRGLNHHDLAATLHLSEQAAQKRVTRAVARLRATLGSSASLLAASVIATLLAERSTHAAPPHLAANSLTALKRGATGRTELILKGITAMKKAYLLKLTAGTTAALLIASLSALAFIPAHAPIAAPTIPALAPAAERLPPISGDAPRIVTGTTSTTNGALLSTLTLNRADQTVIQKTSGPACSATSLIIGPNEWCYRDGIGGGDDALILKKKPIQDAAAKFKELDANFTSLTTAPATRDPSADTTINNIPCHAYRLAPIPMPPDTAGNPPKPSPPLLVSIDPATNRPIRINTGNADVTLIYDPPLPPDYFKLPTTPNTQNVNTRDYLEKKYPLDGALTTAEGVGAIFAVHEATQDAAGCFHIICSSRPLADVRPALNNPPDDQNLTLFMMDPRANLHFHYITVAQLRESGMQITYLIAVPDKAFVPDNICQLPLTMASADTLLTAAGIPFSPHSGHDVHIPISLERKPQPNAPTAAQFATRAYNDIAPLVGITPETTLLGPHPDSALSSPQDCIAALQKQLQPLLANPTSP